MPVGVVYCAPAQTALSLNSRRAQYTTPTRASLASVKDFAEPFSFTDGVAAALRVTEIEREARSAIERRSAPELRLMNVHLD